MAAALLPNKAIILSQTSSGGARPSFAQSSRLEKLTRDVVAAAVEKFGRDGLTADKIALTVIDLNDRQRPSPASYRGQEQIYPASVVKLFYLVAASSGADRRIEANSRA
ncbi:MAG: hypothetical protein AABN33_15250 [Acidobacteriota bacterium]